VPHTDLSVDNEIIDVSIVIVSFNTKDVTRQCLEHVRKHAAAVKHVRRRVRRYGGGRISGSPPDPV